MKTSNRGVELELEYLRVWVWPGVGVYLSRETLIPSMTSFTI